MQKRVRAVIVGDGRVLTIRRFRPDKDKHYWVFPGGGREEGESDLEALKRELEHELGLKVEVLGWFETVPFQAPGEELQVEIFYSCRIVERPNVITYLNQPKIGIYEVEWLPLGEIDPNMLLEPFAVRDKLLTGGDV